MASTYAGKGVPLDIDGFFRSAADAVGATPDQLKLIFCLLIDYPLANVFIRLPKGNALLKHVFNLSISGYYMFGFFKLYSGGLQLLASALATFFIAKFERSKNMPWIVFGVVMGHLFINHIYRTLNKVNWGDFDITGPQMVLTLKLTSYAWSIWDGRRPAEELDKGQMAARITKEPSLLEFLGYAFYFPAVLVGHSSDLNTYLALTRGTIFDECKEDDAKRHVPRGRKRVAYKRGLLGLVFLGLYTLLSPMFNFYRVLQDDWFNHNLITRLLIVQFIGFVERTKYYGVWKLSEGACIVTGLGFSGYDSEGRSTWDDIANLNIPWVEFAPNLKILLDSWNIRTNIWLRECVYKRITPKGRKPGFQSTILTFLTSAVWHGTYSGYYLTFLIAGFVQTAARLARVYLRPLFLSPLEMLPPKLPDALAKHGITLPAPPRTLFKMIYDVLGTITTLLILNFMVAPFLLWHWKPSLEAWSRMNWYGLWMVGLAFAFFYGGGGALCKKLNEERIKRAPKDVAWEIVGETYIHPTLRTDEMQGTGLQNVPPVDQVAREMEELIDKLVENIKAEAKAKKTK